MRRGLDVQLSPKEEEQHVLRFGLAQELDFVKVGSVAAFLLMATVIAAILTAFTIPTSEPPWDDTGEFLSDLASNKWQAMASVWLFMFAGLFIAPVFLGLYEVLRRWGEGYMRLSVLFSVGAAILFALSGAPVAVLAAYIVPAWATADDASVKTAVFSSARLSAELSAVMLSMFAVVLAVAIMASSGVMLRRGERWWRALGYIGLTGSFALFAGTFSPAEERFQIGYFISVVLLLIWLLGVGVALWRLPAAEAA